MVCISVCNCLGISLHVQVILFLLPTCVKSFACYKFCMLLSSMINFIDINYYLNKKSEVMEA